MQGNSCQADMPDEVLGQAGEIIICVIEAIVSTFSQSIHNSPLVP